MDQRQKSWTITPSGNSGINLWSIVQRYKDLLFALVRRELTAGYQATAIGVLWLFIQPLLTTVLYFIIFGRIVKVQTDGIPPFLFYMLGSICWNFFSDCFFGAMYSFVHQAHILQKVYFPRVLIPIALTISHGIRFCIQFILFVILFAILHTNSSLFISATEWLLVPLCFLQIILLSLGFGMLISISMLKYKDIEFVIQFFFRLALFATPVLYPISLIPVDLKVYFYINPLTSVFDTLRAVFFQSVNIQYTPFIVSLCISIVIFFIGLVRFTKSERKIIDLI